MFLCRWRSCKNLLTMKSKSKYNHFMSGRKCHFRTQGNPLTLCSSNEFEEFFLCGPQCPHKGKMKRLGLILTLTFNQVCILPSLMLIMNLRSYVIVFLRIWLIWEIFKSHYGFSGIQRIAIQLLIQLIGKGLESIIMTPSLPPCLLLLC